LAVLVGIKTASCLIHGIVMPCHFTNPCTSYWISGALSLKKSVPKIPSCRIEKFSGTTSILSGYHTRETWIEPTNSTKPSFISIIYNLSSLRMCVSVCTFLALTSLGSAPMSIMKTRSGSSPSTDIVMTEETDNFFGFITATLRSLSSVPSPESLSRSPDVSYSDRSRFIRWPRVSPIIAPWIIVLTFATFFNFVSYILTIIALFEVPFVSYTCRFITPIIWFDVHCYIARTNSIGFVVIVFFIFPFSSLKTSWGREATDSPRGNLREEVYTYYGSHLALSSSLIRRLDHFIHFGGWEIVSFFYYCLNVTK